MQETGQTGRATGSVFVGVIVGVAALIGSWYVVPVSESNGGWTYNILAVLVGVLVAGGVGAVTRVQRRTLVGFVVGTGGLAVLAYSAMILLSGGTS